MLEDKELARIEAEVQTMNAEAAIQNYVAVRDSLSDGKTAFKAVEERHDGVIEKLQMRLRDIADDMGVDQLSSRKFGTAFRVTKESYRVGDWNAFVDWMKKHNAFHCVEKRAAKLAVKEVHTTDGEVPPGITYHSEVEMQVRRPAK